MKLLQELHINTANLLEEGKGADKKMYIKGVFMQSDIVNRNKRLYPKPIMERALGVYKTNYVDQNRAVGELGHPKTPSINPERVSHKIVNLRMEGKNVHGKALVLNTASGQTVKQLFDGDVNLGVSSRGAGSLRQDPVKGYNIVQEDFIISTAADIVLDPSAPDAFVDAILEGKEWIFEEGSQEWKEIGMEKAQKTFYVSQRKEKEKD